MLKIKTIKANADNFSKFGSLVALPEMPPTSQADQYQFWSDISSFKINGETEIGICKVFRQPKDIITGFERHLKTSEILIPIDAPFVLPLLMEDQEVEKTSAFKVDVGQAVVINPGVWHGACIPIVQTESSYFVIFKRNTPKSDVFMKDTIEMEIIGI